MKRFVASLHRIAIRVEVAIMVSRALMMTATFCNLTLLSVGRLKHLIS